MTTASRRARHHVEFVMGMAVSIDVRDEVTPGAIDEVVDLLHHVDATFSPYRMDSSISRLGLGLASFDEMPDEVTQVLGLCEEVYDDTAGAFDHLSVPAPNGSRLDPSGLVKGWAIERAAELLVRHGATNLCINAGGDIALRGAPQTGRSWSVGIRHPDDPTSLATVIAASGCLAIATSATYERGAHIVDPRSGEPTTELAGVTIVGPDLTYVDAYATAVFVMGLDGLTWLIDRHPDHAAFAITHEGRTYSTPTFAGFRA